MSKGSRKSGRKPDPATPSPAAASAGLGATGPATAGTTAGSPPETSWLDSSDPRRRLLGQIVLAGVWVYVAALWLLALDQTFNWGIFGPKMPPLP